MDSSQLDTSVDTQMDDGGSQKPKPKKKPKRKLKISLPQLQSLNLRSKEGFASTKSGTTFHGKVKKVYDKRSEAWWRTKEHKTQRWERQTHTMETISGDKLPVQLWTPTERPAYQFPQHEAQTTKVTLTHPAAKHAAYLNSRLRNLEVHLMLARQKLRQLQGLPPTLTLDDLKDRTAPKRSKCPSAASTAPVESKRDGGQPISKRAKMAPKEKSKRQAEEEVEEEDEEEQEQEGGGGKGATSASATKSAVNPGSPSSTSSPTASSASHAQRPASRASTKPANPSPLTTNSHAASS